MDVFNNYAKEIYNYKRRNKEEIIQIGSKKEPRYYNFVPSGFDIETTTQYEKDKNDKVINHYTNMYIWQFSFGVNDIVFFGRTWSDFSKLLKAIEKHYCYDGKKFICFIHNMSFESAFMIKELHELGHTIETFAREKRHPMELIIDDKIVFLDSLKLTGFSLEKLAKNYTKTQKLKGDLDYNLIRNQYTPLTNDELNYCRNDVLILAEYAEIYKNTYLLQNFMPVTKTMIANRSINDNIKRLKANKEVHNTIYYNYPTTMEQYNYIMSYFTGAYTHGMLENLFNTHENVLAFDVCSEYPFCLMNFYYPMGNFKSITKELLIDTESMKKLLSTYCVLVDVTFTNIRTKTGVTIISENKCTAENPVCDNGRLWSATECTTKVTEIDLQTLALHYEWDTITYNHGIFTKRGKLPKYYRLSVADLYAKKCTLKGIKGKEVEYMVSKQNLNGLYGALACRLSEEEIIINDFGEWDSIEQVQDFNKLRLTKKTLPQWSIYCTSWARFLILSMVEKTIKATRKKGGKSSYLYSDTDSIKVLNSKEVIKIFDEYNEQTRYKNQEWIDELELDKLYPTVDFSEMGTFTNETMENGELTPLKRFKTLGAKRYLSESYNGVIESTVAGLSKRAFLDYISTKEQDAFELFTSDGVYLSDGESQKLGLFYEDERKQFEVIDYLGNKENVTTESYVSLIPISFKMTVQNKLTLLYNEITSNKKYENNLRKQ